MLVCINGKWVSAEEARVSIFDRSFLYGDGVFETLRAYRGRLFRFAEHFERLERGAKFLKISLPFTVSELERCAHEVLERNGEADGIVRMQITRGTGPRGYSPARAVGPTWTITLHPAPSLEPPPPAWRLRTCPWRVSSRDPLASFKTCNKLLQVIARADAETHDADDSLLLNELGHVAETTCSNAFWISGRTVCTPPVGAGILPGITRAVVIELCNRLSMDCIEVNADLSTLKQAEGVFLTFSSLEIVEVASIDGHGLSRAAAVQELRAAFREVVTIQ